MPACEEALAFARRAHQAGDLATAALLYVGMIEANPDDAVALGLLGLARHQQGALADAIASYRRALAVRPDDAETHHNLGLAYIGLKRADLALSHFEEAVRLRPDHADAWNNLGNLLAKAGNNERAIACYQEAMRLRPGFAEACFNLGNVLREEDRVVEAVAGYREALRLRPDYMEALNNLGAALLELGKMEDAAAALREALRLAPASSQSLYNLAAHGLYSDRDPGHEQLRAWLADSRRTPQETSQLHFTLGHLLDSAGDYDAAFAHFRAGNDLRCDILRREGAAFEPAAHSMLIERLISVFDSARLERPSPFGSRSDEPVFIVGMPRSGSTLVEQILSNHPDAGGAGELRELPQLAERLPVLLASAEAYPECISRLDSITASRCAEAYLGALRRRGGAARRITDKMLINFLHLGLAALLFPRARIICCERNPLDTCLSCYFQVFKGLNFTWDLRDLACFYREYRRLLAHWRRALPLPMLEIVYESLVADPEGESRRLVAFCGLEWDDRCLRFHENRRPVRTMSKHQVRRPVYRSSVGRWQHYQAHLGPLLESRL